METQGQRIKKIRQALNLSQEKFGEIFGINKQFVSLLENDKTLLNNEKLVKLALDFKVNINYLLIGEGGMFFATQNNTVVKEELRSEMLQILKDEGIIK